MARWSDGTSNQIIMGEKYIPPAYLGRCEQFANLVDPSAGFPNNSAAMTTDCTAYEGGGPWSDYSNAAAYSWVDAWPTGALVKRESDVLLRDPTPRSGYGWGSYHAGICQFALGDGSVRAMSTNTADIIILMLVDTSDGGTASF
jgi:hypothetical protein